MSALLAAGIAALMTIFDLDRSFYIPRSPKRRVQLYGWMTAFVVTNGLLASGTYLLIRQLDPFKEWNQYVVALAAGAGYLAFIHAKLTTFSWQGQDIPFGTELLYESGRRYVYRRINAIAREARGEETRSLAGQHDLVELVRRARLSIVQDRLLSDEEKKQHKQWVLSVLKDGESDEMEKRLLIANYILSGDT